MADYVEKEFYVNIFNKYLFMYWILVILGTFSALYFTEEKAALEAIIYAIGICIPIAAFTYLISYLVAYQKVVLKLKEDVLDINFVRRDSYSKLYSVDLSRVISYKEVFGYRCTGRMEFYYNDNECIKIPYSGAVYKQLRDEIVDILKNYNIEEKLAF